MDHYTNTHKHNIPCDHHYIIHARGPITVFTGCWGGQPARCIYPEMFEHTDTREIIVTADPGYILHPEAILSVLNLPDIFEVAGYKLSDDKIKMFIDIFFHRDKI